MKKYDAIIIGSGQGGTPLAKKLAKLGLKTVLIEKKEIGGTCINVGCTPTKALIASAKRLHECRQAKDLGVETGEVDINFKKVLARKNKIVKMFRKGAEKGLDKIKGLKIMYGTATFIDKKQLKVILKEGGEKEITGDKIFIDVGARPAIPDIEGLDKVNYFDSTTLMELKEVPEHLLIIGSGYIGLEFGQMYRRFGSKVTIVEAGTRLLPKEDEDIATCIQDFFQEEGIELLTGANISRLDKAGKGIKASIKIGTKIKSVKCSHLLIATGRTPNSDLLKVETAGIKINEKGFIEVNEHLETAIPGIYALGDVKGGPEFTHIAYHDHLVIYKNMINDKKINYTDRLVPFTMFTDPQLGRVGITEEEAKKKKLKFRVASIPMKNVGRAIETGHTKGFMKAIVDEDTGAILGAAILGDEGGEIMTVLQMAMAGNLTWETVREMPIAHPLYAESLNNLFMQLDKK